MWKDEFSLFMHRDNHIPLNMTCEDHELVLGAVQILAHSKCKTLEDVTVLKVPSCNYTSINVHELSQCVNIKELDASSNLFTYFPNDLNLPKLKMLDLSGNRFEHIPLIEQFPALIIVNIDENFGENLNFPALVHFCPNLKFINDQYFNEPQCELFRSRILSSTKVLEPIVKAKWKSDFADCCSNVFDHNERIGLINELVHQLKDLNLLLDDKYMKYKEILIYKITEDYLRSLLNENEDDLLANGTNHISEPVDFYYSDNDDDSNLLKKFADTNKEEMLRLNQLTEDFLGNNVELVVNNILLTADDADGQPQQYIVQQSQPMFHIGQSASQHKSVVMTIFKPEKVKGKPNVDFLPGELRNKDYVKGYMASDIYQKTVKDTLGQKNMTKNNPTNEYSTMPFTGQRKRGRPPKSLLPNQSEPIEKSSKHNFAANENANKVPTRPALRKKNGELRSLNDLDRAGNISKLDYDPLNFIRCHLPLDTKTKVWRCAFEPDPYNPDRTTHIVATCGGRSVCLIDCDQGKVIKEYNKDDEEFMTLAWATIESAPGVKVNILAAAGKLKEIRVFFNDSLMFCDLKGHTEDISALIFHPTIPQIMFSGDTKASVFIWDINYPVVQQPSMFRYQLLGKLRCPRPDVNPVLNLVFLDHYSYLIAGCEDGIFAWKIVDYKIEKKEREPDMELRLLESDKGEASIDAISYDGLAQISPTALVFKIVHNPSLLVFDFGTILERRKGLQKSLPIEVCGKLDWQKTEDFYINVTARCNLRAIMCGDSTGNIWLYDIDPFVEENVEKLSRGFTCGPLKIIEWPECSGSNSEDREANRNPIINTVDLSSDGNYIVSVTDNNLVCIWGLAKNN